MCIINRINERLAVIGKNGAEMSRDLGLSNSAYSQWNTGKTKPSKKTLSLIAPYLETSVEYLLTGKEDPAQENLDGISETQRELLKITRYLPDDQVQLLLQTAQALKASSEHKSKESK